MGVWGQTTIFNYSGGGSVTGWIFEDNITTNNIDQTSYWLLDGNSSTSDIITTSNYDLSPYSSAVFSFSFRNYGTPQDQTRGKIEVSFDGGTTFTQVATTPLTSSTYSSFNLNLASISSQVKIRIKNAGGTNQSKGLRLQSLKLIASGSSCTSPEDSFASSTVTKILGDPNFTNTFTTNSTGTLSYTSSNTGVATINATSGEVTVAGVGITTITAATTANGSFCASSKTYTLTVNPNSHTITYHGNGNTGGNAPVDPLSPYAINSAVTVLGNTGGLTKNCSEFAGWNTAANGSGTSYTGGATFNINSDVILYAQWDPTSHTVTFENNNGTGTMAAQSACTNTALNSNTFTRTGYSFNGWNTLANGTGTSYANNATYDFSANITLFAQWTPNQYTITFSGNGQISGTPSVPIATGDFGSSVILAGQGTLDKPGYTFAGWNTNAAGTGTNYAANSSYTISTANNITLYAKWTPNTYQVIFNGNGSTGGTMTDQNFVFGTTANLTNKGYTRTGYTFLNWNTAANGSGTSYSNLASFTMSSPSNVTLYAQWQVYTPPVPKRYDLVTSESQLVAGKKYLIVNSATPGSATALGKQATNNRNASNPITINGSNSIYTFAASSNSEDLPFEITLGGSAGNWTLYDAANTGYLYAANTGSNTNNHLKNRLTPIAAWVITISSETNVAVMEDSSNSTSRRFLQVNSNLFSCYTNGSQAPAFLYVENNCISPADPQGTISATTPACNSITLSYSGSDKANAYWVSGSLGQEIDKPATSDLTVTTSGTYYLRIKVGECWSDSAISKIVEVNTTPVITTQPVDQMLSAPNAATFSVTATGGGLSYQWYVSEDCGATWQSISGATASSYTITPTAPTMNGNRYKVIVSNNCGSVTSEVAELKILDLSVCINVDFTSAEGWLSHAYTDNWTQNIYGTWNGSGVNVVPSNSRVQFRDTGDSYLELPHLRRPVKIEFKALLSGSQLGVNDIAIQKYNSTTLTWETINTITVSTTSYVNKVIDLSALSTTSDVKVRLYREPNSITSRTIFIDNITVTCSTIPEFATDYTWTGGSGTTSWDDYCNWSPKGVPTEVDNVRFRIATGLTNTLNIADARTVNNLIIDEVGVFNVGSTGNFKINGNITYNNALGATANFDCASTFSIASTSSQVIPPFNYGNLNTSGGDRVIAASNEVGVCGTFVSGTGTFTMNSSTVHYNGDNQPINQDIEYYKVHFSGNGTKSPSGPLNIHVNGEVIISDNAVVNYDSNNFGATATNSTMLTMTGGRLVLGTTGLQPRFDGNYKLSGGIIEFSNKDTATGSTIRNKQYVNSNNTGYQNIEITGNTITNSSGIIGLNTNGTFTIKKDGIYTSKSPVAPIKGYDTSSMLTVENGGLFKTEVPLGFYGGLIGTNYPSVADNVNVILKDGSTVEYSRAADQTITNVAVNTPADSHYANLKITGSGTKTAIGETKVNGITTIASADATLLVPATADFDPVVGGSPPQPNVFFAKAGIDNSNATKGNFVLGNNAMLMQNPDADNTKAKIEVQRISKMKRLDYTYWGAPVQGQVFKDFSPNTVATRFYTYNEIDGSFTPIADYATTSFAPAKGYAIRAPNSWNASSQQPWTGKFMGKPNNENDNISIGLDYHEVSSEDPDPRESPGLNMISNPFPSNIDLAELQKLNSGLIDGVFYFWTNTNKFDSNVTTDNGQYGIYSANNYATLNLLGSVPATSNVVGNPLYPSPIIKPGQGFLVHAKAAGTLNFTNNIRTKANTDGDHHSVFFSARNSNAVTDRFWLYQISPAQNRNILLIGYTQGATNDFDSGFDALVMPASDSFYSIEGARKLAIQGRNYPLLNTDVVPLGSSYFKTGDYTIGIQEKEGIFANGQHIYLKDKQKGIITDLSEGAYTYTATAGDTNSRFEIIYKPETVLATDEGAKDDLQVYRVGDDFVIKSARSRITGIEVYDTSGKLMLRSVANQTEVRLDGNHWVNGVYVIKIDRTEEMTTRKIRK